MNDSPEVSKTKGSSILVAFFICTLVVGGIYFFNYYKSTISTDSINPVVQPNATYLSLRERPEFMDAMQKLRAGQIEEGIRLLRSITPSDNFEHSYIQYEIANAQLKLDRMNGTNAFLDLIASTSINLPTKAYSVNTLARLYMAVRDEEMLDAVKQGLWRVYPSAESVSALVNAESPRDAYMEILKFGSSLFPITDTEMRLAYEYAYTAEQMKAAGNEEGFETNKNLALEKLALAETDPNATKTSENLMWMLPDILNRKAMTLDKLIQANVEVSESPEVVYKQALDLSRVRGISIQPFIQFNYAGYLARTEGTARAEDIVALVEPLVAAKQSREMRNFVEFLRNATNSDNASSHVENLKNINAVQEIYPTFATLWE